MDLSMVTLEFRVDSNMITVGEKMREADILRQFQQTGMDHLEYAGHGLKVLQAEHQMFLLSRNSVRFYRRPEYYEKLTSMTCTPRYEGVFNVRYYAMRDASGELVADSCSYWTLLDSEKFRIIRPGHVDDSYLPKKEAFTVTAPPPGRLTPPEGMTEIGRHTVQLHETDQYGHLNNTRYVDIIRGLLPADERISELEMNYNRQLPPGAEFSVFTDGQGFYSFVRDGANCFCAIVKTVKE